MITPMTPMAAAFALAFGTKRYTPYVMPKAIAILVSDAAFMWLFLGLVNLVFEKENPIKPHVGHFANICP